VEGVALEKGVGRGIHVSIPGAHTCKLMFRPVMLQEKQAEQQATAAAREETDEQEEEEDLPLFEVQRRANIKRNRQRMASMGLSSKKLPASLPGESFLHLFLYPVSGTLFLMVVAMNFLDLDCADCSSLLFPDERLQFSQTG